MSGIADSYDRAQPVHGPGREPLVVSATPYLWRDPATLPRRPWIYGRRHMRGQVGGKFAPGGAGKTTHEIGDCIAMATGRDILGAQVWDGPKRVWLWNLEDSSEEIARTVQATCKHWGIGEADLGGRLFVDSALDGAVLKLAAQTSNDGVVINEPLVEALVEELLKRQIDYLTIDPFISSHSVEENDNGAIDAVVKKWAQVAKRANCAITLTHHVRKSQGGEVTAEQARGASSLVAACRSALVLNRMSEKEAEGYGIGPEERRRYFRIYDDKNNRAPPADKSQWFMLASVDLGNSDDPLRPGDSIGVVEPWSPPGAFDDVSVADLLAVQNKVAENVNVRSNAQAARWVGNLVAEVLSLNSKDAADRRKINMLVKTWVLNGALVEVERPDRNGDERKFIEVGDWADRPGPSQSAPVKTEVRTGAEGAGNRRPPAPAPPIYRGAGVRGAAEENTGAGAVLAVGSDLVPRTVAPTRTVFPPPHDDDDPASDF